MQPETEAAAAVRTGPGRWQQKHLNQTAGCVLVAWAALWFWHTRALWTQTGYLHIDFAETLEQGGGYGAGGRQVLGDASPLWVALLSGGHTALQPITGDWVATGKVLAIVAVVAMAAGLFFWTERLAASTGAGRAGGGGLVLLLVALSPFWGAEAFAGTESLAAAAVACWACACVAGPLTSPLRPRRLLAACACAGCGPLLRPEMVLFSLCLAPVLFARWVNTPVRFRVRVLTFFSGLLLAVGPGAGWLLYTAHTFGTAVPNALRAGMAGPGESATGIGLARLAVGAPWLVAAFSALVFQGGRWLPSRRRGVAPVRRVGGDVGLGWRGIDPSLVVPLVWLPLSGALFLLIRHAVNSADVLLFLPACTAAMFTLGWELWPRATRVAVPLGLLYGVVVSSLLAWPATGRQIAGQTALAELAHELHSLPGETVAMAPAAEVLFLTHRRVVDLGGVLEESALLFRWDATEARRVWWAHGHGARLMWLDHPPEPGSTALWTRDLPHGSFFYQDEPGDPPRMGLGNRQTFDRLTLWRLPPSPTLAFPAPDGTP